MPKYCKLRRIVKGIALAGWPNATSSLQIFNVNTFIFSSTHKYLIVEMPNAAVHFLSKNKNVREKFLTRQFWWKVVRFFLHEMFSTLLQYIHHT